MLNFDEIVRIVDDEKRAEEAAAVQGGVQPIAPDPVMPDNQVVTDANKPAPKEGTGFVAPTAPPTFLEQIEAVRSQKSGEWEKREKADRARGALVGLTDGLSALANLIATTKGAPNQPRQSAFPFFAQNVEQRRAQDRADAERLRTTELSYQQMLDRYAAQGELADTRLAAEKERTNRALQVEGMRNDRAQDNNASKERIAAGRNENRVQLKEMDLKYRGDRDKMLNYFKQQGLNISREKLDEMIRHNQSMEVISEKKGSGGGNVGGYKVVITRDEYGREVSRERIPTTSGESIEWDDKEDDNKIDW